MTRQSVAVTHYVRLKRSPRWNATPENNVGLRMNYDSRNSDSNCVLISLWDRDTFLKDFFLGRCVVDVSALTDSRPCSQWFDVYAHPERECRGLLSRVRDAFRLVDKQIVDDVLVESTESTADAVLDDDADPSDVVVTGRVLLTFKLHDLS